MMLTNLADILRGAGLRVIETPGWRSRGHGQMSAVRGVLWHHTATSAQAGGDYPSQRIVTDGRSDLPGPLCNVGLGRNGTWYIVAAGLAYHAGSGSYPGIGSNGNGTLIGVEAEHPGTAGTPWPPAQIDSYRRGTAALLRAYGLGPDRCIGHKEWAPRRKIDPAGLDMNAERGFVGRFINVPGQPAPAPPPPGGIEDMALDTRWKDSYGNWQTIESWMSDIQRKLNDVHYPLVSPGSMPSRIPGDKNKTNVRDAVMDSTSWTAQILGHVAAQRATIDKLAELLAKQQGLDAATVKTAVAEALAEGIDLDVTASVPQGGER